MDKITPAREVYARRNAEVVAANSAFVANPTAENREKLMAAIEYRRGARKVLLAAQR